MAALKLSTLFTTRCSSSAWLGWRHLASPTLSCRAMSSEPFHPIPDREPRWVSADEAVSHVKSGKASLIDTVWVIIFMLLLCCHKTTGKLPGFESWRGSHLHERRRRENRCAENAEGWGFGRGVLLPKGEGSKYFIFWSSTSAFWWILRCKTLFIFQFLELQAYIW